jgi:hypothetical protein
LPRSTVSLILSFTLNQASARTSHLIVPSRENGKFTCLGFVRGCFWVWLYWSGSWIYDSWNGLSSSHIQKWSRHYHLFLGKRLIWCLPIILIYETYLLLSSTSLLIFQSSDPQINMLKKPHTNTKLSTIEFPSDKRSQAYHWNTPPFFLFEKDDSSDLWEVATCLSALLWMMEWFHVPCAHRCWNCAYLRLVAGGDGASKYLSSWSLLIQSANGRSLFLTA